MATLDWTVARVEQVTFVELVVTSDIDERVEIESCLRPVWPPRRRGRPVAGWDDHRFTGLVTATDPLVLGYASPADTVEPPAELTDCQPAADDSDGDGTPSPRMLVRALGTAEPPRDAVPVPETEETRRDVTDTLTDDREGETRRDGTDTLADDREAGETRRDVTDTLTDDREGETGTDGTRARRQSAPVTPPEAWFEAVERRAEAARRLAGTGETPPGHDPLGDTPGVETAQDLHEQLVADSRRLGAVRERCRALETRLDALDPGRVEQSR